MSREDAIRRQYWIDVEIARFIRKHGAFADLRAALSNTKGEWQ